MNNRTCADGPCPANKWIPSWTLIHGFRIENLPDGGREFTSHTTEPVIPETRGEMTVVSTQPFNFLEHLPFILKSNFQNSGIASNEAIRWVSQNPCLVSNHTHFSFFLPAGLRGPEYRSWPQTLISRGSRHPAEHGWASRLESSRRKKGNIYEK